jgi:hypothetical protein
MNFIEGGNSKWNATSLICLTTEKGPRWWRSSLLHGWLVLRLRRSIHTSSPMLITGCAFWDLSTLSFCQFWALSCTNTSCKDDIVLNRWERLLRATEWLVTTVTVTHIKWNDRNENKSIYTTLSPTQTTQAATKRNEILPLHQEVVNRLEAHFTNKQESNHSPTYKVKSAPFFKNECTYVKNNKVQSTVLLHNVGDSTWKRWVSPQPHGRS